MFRKVIGALVVLGLMATSGCSTLASSTQKVRISCAQSDAVLDVSGTKYRGATELEARRNRDIEVTCSKPGYLTSSRTIRTTLSGTGMLDAMGGLILLLPAVGLATPGAWNLDASELLVPMELDR